MPDYKCKAKQYGDSVEFEVSASDIKEALAKAKLEAKKIFDWQQDTEIPSVSVKEVKEKEEE